MQVYKSKISTFSIIIFIILILIIITPLVTFFTNENENNLYGILIFTLIYFAFIFSIAFKTEYKINNTKLHWQTGFIFGQFDIKSITKIKKHNGIYVPTIWKPALSHVGLLIYYNKFDDIYISPKQEEFFLKQLLEINPQIEVI